VAQIQNAGVPRRVYFKKRAELRARVARAMRAPGATVADVAARLVVSPFTVYRACREHGLNLRRGGSAGAFALLARRNARIVAAVRRGMTTAEAAIAIGVSRDTVRVVCRARGVAAPPPATPLRVNSMTVRASLARRLTGPRRRRLWKELGGSSNAATVAKLLLDTPLTYSEISEVCGVSRQRVHQVLRQLQGAAAVTREKRGESKRRPDPAIRS
jgi:transposase